MPQHLTAANTLAQSLQLPLRQQKDTQYSLQLCYLENYIELFSSELNTAIHIDFCSGKLAHRHQYGGGRGQAIARALGLKQGRSPSVLDATAGLATDAFTLATLGSPVIMLERSTILTTLINDAIKRARNEPALDNLFQQGFCLHNIDAIDYMQQLSTDNLPDVIYLDPMYPEKKTSARVKKTMQILQLLHGADDNASELLKSSLQYARKRVVIKRPVHAQPVNTIKPSTHIKSKNTRYDIYAIEKI